MDSNHGCYGGGKQDIAKVLISCPRVNLDSTNFHGQHVEDICRENMKNKEHLEEVLDHLGRFTGPRLRMIKTEARQVTTHQSTDTLQGQVIIESWGETIKRDSEENDDLK